MARHIVSIENIAALKNFKAEQESIVITLGQTTKGDSKGALYYYDPSDTSTAQDNSYFNTVTSNVVNGRWKKVFTRMLTLPHGTLVLNSGKREFFCSTIINSSSEATINLTLDNTVNGVPIFAEIWFDDSKAMVSSISNANDAVTSCRKTLSANLKQLTHFFYRGNNSNSGALNIAIGINMQGFRNAVAGTPAQFKVEGI